MLGKNLKAICYNENNRDYPNYGGKGISVCERWKNSFQNFYKDIGPRPEGYILKIIDKAKDIDIDNVTWSPKVK